MRRHVGRIDHPVTLPISGLKRRNDLMKLGDIIALAKLGYKKEDIEDLISMAAAAEEPDSTEPENGPEDEPAGEPEGSSPEDKPGKSADDDTSEFEDAATFTVTLTVLLSSLSAVRVIVFPDTEAETSDGEADDALIVPVAPDAVTVAVR